MPFIFHSDHGDKRDIYSFQTSLSYAQVCMFVRSLGSPSVSRNEQSYLEPLGCFLANQCPSHSHSLPSFLSHMTKADGNGAVSISLYYMPILFKPECCWLCQAHISSLVFLCIISSVKDSSDSCSGFIYLFGIVTDFSIGRCALTSAWGAKSN